MADLKFIVYRPADEFKAADAASEARVAEYRRAVAEELVKLIKLDGNEFTYRLLRKREETRTGKTLLVPMQVVASTSSVSA